MNNEKVGPTKLSIAKKAQRSREGSKIVCVTYRDHVFYHMRNPLPLAPAVRKAVGWLLYQAPDYVIIAWDLDAGMSSLNGGGPKASGLVILRSDILEIREVFSS